MTNGDLDSVIEELTISNHLPCHIWYDLGLQLGLYQPTLEDINEDNNGDSKKCFRQCMSAWLRGEDKVREKGGPKLVIISYSTGYDQRKIINIVLDLFRIFCLLLVVFAVVLVLFVFATYMLNYF